MDTEGICLTRNDIFCLWLLLALFTFLPCRLEGADSSDASSSVMEVRSGKDLAIAFTYAARIDTALIVADIWMLDTDWLGLRNGSEPILLTRNFAIVGSPSLPRWPLLNLGFVHGKIRIGNGVTLMVRHVVVGDFRSDLLTQAPGFDLAAKTLPEGPPGKLLHHETAVTYSVCLPRSIWSIAINTSQRAASRPGVQAFALGVPQPDCLNVTSTTARPELYPPAHGLALQPRLQDRCWADRGVFFDIAVTGADVTTAGRATEPNNYDVILLNVTFMCASVISNQCVAQLKDPVACALSMVANDKARLPWRLPDGPEAEVSVRSGRELAAALAAAPLVTSVVVERDIWLREADWEGLLGGPNGSEPAVLSRDVVVKGSPRLGSSWPLLSLGFVRHKIRLASGVSLTFRHLLIGDFQDKVLAQGPGCDLAAATSIDAYDTNPGLLVHDETALLYALCFPAPTWNASLANAARPASHPGSQTFTIGIPQPCGTASTSAAAAAATRSVPTSTSVPASSSSSSTGDDNGVLQPPLLSRCWADRGVFLDVAVAGADVDEYGHVVLMQYDIVLQNVSYICANVTSEACLGDHGSAGGCVLWTSQQLAGQLMPWQEWQGMAAAEALNATPLEAAGVVDGGRGGLSGAAKAGAVGGAIGGAALLAVVATAMTGFIFVRRRRRQGLGPGPVESKPHVFSLLSAPETAAAVTAGDGDGGVARLDLWGSGSGGGDACLPAMKVALFHKAAAAAAAAEISADPAAAGKSAPARGVTVGSTDAGTATDSIAAGGGGGGGGSGYGSRSEEDDSRGNEENGGGRSTGAAALGSYPVSRDGKDAAAGMATETATEPVERNGGVSVNGGGGGGGSVNDAGTGTSEDPVPSSFRQTGDPSTQSGGSFADSSKTSSQQQLPMPPPTSLTLLYDVVDEHVVVTPLTPPRKDLALGEAAAAEVTLLPVVRGKGAFGRVYEGMYGGEKVAVKVMRDVGDFCSASGGGGGGGGGRGHLDHVLDSFAQEVEVLGRCRHPNVVRLLAACLTPPKLLLVMELMETSLEKLVYNKSGELMPLTKVLYIALDVAKGLEYLHPTILHRDLKPGNVLINGPASPRPIAKLTDFGVSRLRDTVLITKHPEAGTPAYMAPETFDVKNYTLTHHVDMYSFGVLLWVLLTGQHPWKGFQMIEVAYKVTINQERLSTTRIPPSRCPARLRALMEQCWEYEPRRRPAAAEAVKVLQSLLDSQVVA